MSTEHSVEEKEVTHSTDSPMWNRTHPRATFNNRKYNEAKWV